MRTAHMVPNAHWAGNLLAVLHLRPSRLAIIVPPWEFGLALTSYHTHRRTSNFSQTAPIIGSQFSDRAHYNEFVESGAKSWAAMRWQLVLGMKGTQNRAGQSSQGEGPFARGRECTNPLSITQKPSSCFWASLLFFPRPLFGWSLLLFIHLFRSSSSYTCQSSIPLLKCTSPQPSFLALCELLWPPSPCPGVTSTSKGVRVLVVRI